MGRSRASFISERASIGTIPPALTSEAILRIGSRQRRQVLRSPAHSGRLPLFERLQPETALFGRLLEAVTPPCPDAQGRGSAPGDGAVPAIF